MSTSIANQQKSTSITRPNFSGLMNGRQSGLAKKYKEQPGQAWVTDVATTGQGSTLINDPLHSTVTTAGLNIPIGVHPAVGGDGDAPVPGELLSAALASCMDSTIRIIANRLSIELTHLEVIASAEVDVRGTLRLKQSVPVAFQKMHLSVDIETSPKTKPEMVKILLAAAETSCVVMQTLRNPAEISTQLNILNK